MKSIRKISCILLAIVFIKCGSSQNVTTNVSRDAKYDMDKTIDFHEFKTYQLAVLNDENNIVPFLNDLNRNRLINAIQGNMGKKGMALSGEPDVILADGVNIDEKRSFSTFGSMAGGMGVTTSDEYVSYRGTITLALLERDTDKLMWYGLSEKELEGDPKNTERNINQVVAQIFEAFPIDHFGKK